VRWAGYAAHRGEVTNTYKICTGIAQLRDFGIDVGIIISCILRKWYVIIKWYWLLDSDNDLNDDLITIISDDDIDEPLFYGNYNNDYWMMIHPSVAIWGTFHLKPGPRSRGLQSLVFSRIRLSFVTKFWMFDAGMEILWDDSSRRQKYWNYADLAFVTHLLNPSEPSGKYLSRLLDNLQVCIFNVSCDSWCNQLSSGLSSWIRVMSLVIPKVTHLWIL
jgi:hypothetical protein